MGATGTRFRGVTTALALVLLGAAWAVAPAPADAAKPDMSPNLGHRGATAPSDLQPVTAVVRYKDGTGAAQRAAARQRAGVAKVRNGAPGRLEVVRPAKGQSVDAAVAAMQNDPAVESAEPNLRRQLAANPADEPYFGPYQWGLENDGSGCIPGVSVTCRADVDIDAAGAWPLATGAGITVAVLDDGVDFSHPDLEGQAWVNPGESGDDGLGGDRATNGIDDDANGYVDDVNGVNLCETAAGPTVLHDDQDAHGTAVASVIAAATNGIGAAGVAPGARIMAVRWLVSPYPFGPAYNECSDDVMAAEAIEYAVDNGADVINASWGGEGTTTILSQAVDYANAHGVLIVAAAGNAGVDTPFYPAAYGAPNVVSVGAIRPDGYRASFSSYGSWVDVAAPGSWIVAAYVADDGSGCVDYCYLDGTSFAAPHVAGIAALVGELRPDILGNPSMLRGRLISSGWKNSKIGSGLTASSRVVDARYALDTTPPVAPGWVTARVRTGTRISSTTASMSLSWAAAADDTSIEYYRVRYRIVGAPSWTTLVSSTTGRSATVSLRFATAYEIEVMARDRGANTVTTVLPVRPTKYEESSTRFSWGGAWTSTSSSSFSGGKARFTGTAGRWAQFAVTGRSVALVAAKGPTRGAANIYVDGKYVSTISLYASTATYRSVVFARAWSTSADHTLKVVVKGTSGRPRVDVDAVIVGR